MSWRWNLISPPQLWHWVAIVPVCYALAILMTATAFRFTLMIRCSYSVVWYSLPITWWWNLISPPQLWHWGGDHPCLLRISDSVNRYGFPIHFYDTVLAFSCLIQSSYVLVVKLNFAIPTFALGWQVSMSVTHLRFYWPLRLSGSFLWYGARIQLFDKVYQCLGGET